MSELLVVKQYISNFVGKYEAYVKPVEKFLLALFTLITINISYGNYGPIKSFGVVMIAALMCSFMPTNFLLFVAAVFITLHMYAMSLESAVVVLVFFLVLFLLYFRLSPKETISVIFTPILAGMGIPYIMPIAMGLAGGPSSAVSIGVGVVIYSVLHSIKSCSGELSQLETEDMAARLKYIVDTILGNKSMILLIVAFSITVMVVYLVKQLQINYSWTVAIIAGAMVDAIIILIGDLTSKAHVSVGGLFIGTILALVVGIIIQFFLYNVDYSRTEKVQFQDDEYFYYVKAIPKRGSNTAKKNRKPSSQPQQSSQAMRNTQPVRSPGSQQVRRPVSNQGQAQRPVTRQTQPVRTSQSQQSRNNM